MNGEETQWPATETESAAAVIPAGLQQRLGGAVLPLLLRLLPQTPDPEGALAALDRYVGESDTGRAMLAGDPARLEILLAIFSHSQFLSETLIQTPSLLHQLAEVRREAGGRSRDDWAARLTEFLAAAPAADAAGRARRLTRFKRREYLRIVLRDVTGLAWLAETTQELSQLADAILTQAYIWAWNDLAGRMEPPAGGGGRLNELAVIGLGKLGGGELNYSSDIDLMFVYGGGEEAAPAAGREFFIRLAQLITEYVSATTPEGAAYRVDLRLRPGGREGELALPLERAIDYYRREARDWELQMLLRARPCAGALGLGERFLEEVRERVYPRQPDAERLAAGMRRMRERIASELEHGRIIGRRRATCDVKLDAGGIRDIEFLCQYLQRLHGGGDAWVRGGNTAIALQRLHDKGYLSGAEFQALSSGYWLLRNVEHRLQLHLGQQTHSLPAADERVGVLARSLLSAEGGRLSAAAAAPPPAGLGLEAAGASADDRARLGAAFRAELVRRMQAVREIYLRHLGASPAGGGTAATPAGRERETEDAAAAPGWLRQSGPQPAWARRLMRQMPLTRHGGRQLQRLLRSAGTTPVAGPGGEAALERLAGSALPRLARALDASDWMAETLIRRPELVRCFMPPEAADAVADAVAPGEAAARMSAIRIAAQERRFAAIVNELETAPAVERTLAALTRAAEESLAAALALVRAAGPGAEAETPLCVLGLGRLGLGELDLLSDLDLVFVSTEAAREPAARLAARLIEALTAYTRDGALFAVDTRLRPGGGEGELVQTATSMAAYFRDRAGAWEAASFLKARAVAGDAALGERALEAMWRAWASRGRDGRELGNELATLRERMEREGRPGRWGLKTPPGGYYDADFILSRRQLDPPPARTPAVVSLAAQARALADAGLPAAAAHALADDILLLRSADHALRVATGKAGRAVPASGDAINRAEQWLARIWPQPLAGTLGETVSAAQQRLRQLYRAMMQRGGGAGEAATEATPTAGKKSLS